MDNPLQNNSSYFTLSLKTSAKYLLLLTTVMNNIYKNIQSPKNKVLMPF